MKKNYFEKSYTKYDGEAILGPFSKKWNLRIFLDQWS